MLQSAIEKINTNIHTRLLLIFLLFFSCTKVPEGQELVDANPLVADIIKDGKAGKFGNIHSLLIYQQGELLAEEYFEGFEKDSVHFQYSVTKSVSSLLIGIALDQGLIKSVDEPVLSFFPEYEGKLANLNQEKQELTLKQVLTMSAGFSWDEWTHSYTDIRNDANKMIRSADMMKFVLDRPIPTKPGTRYTYNSGCSMLLSGIIENSTGMTVQEFATDYLFGPLGISEWHWEQGNDEKFNTGWGLHLHPTDMLKIGQLVLNKGRWNEQEVVSKAWIDTSIQNHIANYGYQWWLSGDYFSARGWGGQVIAISPKNNLIVISTAANFSGGGGPPGVRVMERLLN